MVEWAADPREDAAIALDDEQLVGRIWALIFETTANAGSIDDDAREDNFSDLCALVQEAFERWAPEAQWAHEQRQLREAEKPEILGRALLDAFEDRRRRQATRLLRSTFGDA
jgi:hypothetical protein